MIWKKKPSKMRWNRFLPMAAINMWIIDDLFSNVDGYSRRSLGVMVLLEVSYILAHCL